MPQLVYVASCCWWRGPHMDPLSPIHQPQHTTWASCGTSCAFWCGTRTALSLSLFIYIYIYRLLVVPTKSIKIYISRLTCRIVNFGINQWFPVSRFQTKQHIQMDGKYFYILYTNISDM